MFARLYERLAQYKGDVISLQIGDTHLLPPELSRLDRLSYAAERDLYKYGPAPGWGPLVKALTAKVQARNRIDVDEAGLQVTAGATHALACAIGALFDPGDELILLTPHWPLIHGIARSRSVEPVEVPFSQRLLDDPGADIRAILRAAITPRTRGLYVSSPNNPDGLVLDAAALGAIAEVAAEAGLWIVSDEVYEEYAYDRPHVSIASLPAAAERTVTVFSFSKSYGQAGLRIGYAVGPRRVMEAVRKMANHSIYNVPHALQRAALAALESGGGFLESARARYAHIRDESIAALALPVRVPQGATYLFIDLAPAMTAGDRDALGVLERIAGEGVLLAPGAPFGAIYASWARLCFTAVPEERLLEGIARINRVVGA